MTSVYIHSRPTFNQKVEPSRWLYLDWPKKKNVVISLFLGFIFLPFLCVKRVGTFSIHWATTRDREEQRELKKWSRELCAIRHVASPANRLTCSALPFHSNSTSELHRCCTWYTCVAGCWSVGANLLLFTTQETLYYVIGPCLEIQTTRGNMCTRKQ